MTEVDPGEEEVALVPAVGSAAGPADPALPLPWQGWRAAVPQQGKSLDGVEQADDQLIALPQHAQKKLEEGLET